MQEAVRSAYNGQGEIYLVSEFEPALAAIKSVEPARKPPKVDAFIASVLAGNRKTTIEELTALGHIKSSVRKGVTKSCRAFKHGLITIKEKRHGSGWGGFVERKPVLAPRFRAIAKKQ